MKLIRMTDFVLEQTTKYETDLTSANLENMLMHKFVKDCIRYAQFLKQELKLWIFVPCDENGKVLEQPEYFKYYSDFNNTWQDSKFEGFFDDNEDFNEWKYHCLKYNDALSRVLFKGWTLRNPKKTLGFKIVMDDDFEINLDTLAGGQFLEGGFLSMELQGNTIEAIANQFMGITLTDDAVKALGI